MSTMHMDTFDLQEFLAAKYICNRLQNEGYQAVFTGGCVRDALLDRDCHDIDIATDACPEVVSRIFAHTKCVGEAFGVVLVGRGKFKFEVATFRTDSADSDGRHPDYVVYSTMEEDAKRRDFTCNALYYDPVTDKLHDFVGGMEDIEDKALCFVGDPATRLKEDQLRALRAVRFAAQLGFTPDWQALLALQHASTDKLAPERVKMELDKILLTPKPSVAFALMELTGLLEKVLPEVSPLVTSHHNPEFHPEGNPWKHTKIVLDIVRSKSTNLPVLWGALLHDVGKPATEMWEDGKVTNHGHDEVGASIAVGLLRRLRASNDLIDEVEFLVLNHMKIKHAKEMRKAKLRRLLSSPFAADLLALSIADSEASPVTSRLDWIYFDLGETVSDLPKPLVTGRDLIALGVKPGPAMGALLTKLMDRQLDDEFANKDDALFAAKELVAIG